MISAFIFCMIALFYAQIKLMQIMLFIRKNKDDADTKNVLERALVLDAIYDQRRVFRKRVFQYTIFVLICTLIKTVFIHGCKWF